MAGELHRVLDKVVEAVHDFRAAADERLLAVGHAGGGEDQPDPRIARHRARRLDQRRDRQAGIGRGTFVVRALRQPGEDLAAAFGLA